MPEDIQKATELMIKSEIHPSIMVDCSHGNSEKNHEKQPFVMGQIIEQIEAGQGNISGIMIESYLEAGNQPIPKNLKDMKYGVSITDKCIDWQTTEEMLRRTHARLKACGGRPVAR